MLSVVLWLYLQQMQEVPEETNHAEVHQEQIDVSCKIGLVRLSNAIASIRSAEKWIREVVAKNEVDDDFQGNVKRLEKDAKELQKAAKLARFCAE